MRSQDTYVEFFQGDLKIHMQCTAHSAHLWALAKLSCLFIDICSTCLSGAQQQPAADTTSAYQQLLPHALQSLPHADAWNLAQLLHLQTQVWLLVGVVS